MQSGQHERLKSNDEFLSFDTGEVKHDLRLAFGTAMVHWDQGYIVRSNYLFTVLLHEATVSDRSSKLSNYDNRNQKFKNGQK